MKRVFDILFASLLIAQILLSDRPSEINFPLLFHVGMLGIFLVFGLLTIAMGYDRLPADSLTLITVLFTVYFYTLGVIISALNGAGLLGTIEFPYRISNLFMVLVIPWFVRDEKKLNQLFAILLVMMALQIVRDLALGSSEATETLLAQRLWGQEFTSVMFIGALPFAIGGMFAYWNAPRQRFLKRALLLALWAILLLKIFLTFSRMVWLVIFPLNIVGAYYLIRRNSRYRRDLRQWGKKVARLIVSLVVAGIIVISLLAVFTPKATEIILKRGERTNLSIDNRLDEYTNALEEWLTSPVWGDGFGVKTRFYKGKRLMEQDYVHNFILQFLKSGGILGLMLILLLLGTPFWRLWRLLKTPRSLLQAAILIAGLLTMMNIVLVSSVQTVILKQDAYFLLAVVISFAVIITRLQREEQKSAAHQGWMETASLGAAKRTKAVPGWRMGLR